MRQTVEHMFCHLQEGVLVCRRILYRRCPSCGKYGLIRGADTRAYRVGQVTYHEPENLGSPAGRRTASHTDGGRVT